MDKVQDSIRARKPLGHVEFEQRVYCVVSERKGDYHFAESIVDALHDSQQYVEVYNHMKADGMNI